MTTRQPVIRPEASGDFAAIREVVAAAFGGSAEADLVDHIRNSSGYLPDLALVAIIDARIVGHVMVSTASLRHSSGERAVALLSPLAVDPASQRGGIGAALVAEVAAAADRAGEPFIVLEGSPMYYGRLGFRAASVFGVTMPLPDWAPVEAAQLLPLSGFDARDPTIEGDVVYPPPFHGLGE